MGLFLDPFTGQMMTGEACGVGSCVLVTNRSSIGIGHGEVVTGSFHPNFGNPLLANTSRFITALEDSTLTRVSVQLNGANTVTVNIRISIVGGATLSALSIPAGTDQFIDSGTLTTAITEGDKIQVEVVNGDPAISAVVVLDMETSSCDSASGGGSTPTTTTYTFSTTSVTLANGQSSMADYTVSGVLLTRPTSVSLVTDVSAFTFVGVYAYIVADNKIRVEIKNETGSTVVVPALTFKVLQN